MKPVRKARKVPQRNQRVVSSRPRSRRAVPNQETASMISPSPTMIRKLKKGISTGGWSSNGKVSSPISRAVQLPEAMKLPSFGSSTAKRFRFSASSGIADQHLACRLLRLPARLDRCELRRLMIEHGRGPSGGRKELDRDQRATSPRPQCSITRASARWTPRSMYQAPVGRHAHAGRQEGGESSMCGQRTRMIDPVVIAHQSAG